MYKDMNATKIQSSKFIDTDTDIDLDTYDVENDPDGIFDVDSMDDDTSLLFSSYDEYKKYIAIFDAR
nr:MAG TPA: hypothetical protein [Caudoviricetes sp.]